MPDLVSPTVSIVMPTYDRADLLPETVESILDQSYMDIELLIIDDGSADNTTAVVAEIQEHDPRVHYVRLPENRGVGFSRHAGLKHVSGRYLAIADSDDLWLPGKLKSQVEAMEKYPSIEILFGDFWNIDHVQGTKARGFRQTQAGLAHLVTHPVESDLWIVKSGVEIGILKADFVQPAGVLLRAEVFDKVGSFDPSLMTVDHEFYWRAAVLGAKFAYIDRPLIERHRYESSTTNNVLVSLMHLLTCLDKCRDTAVSVNRPMLMDHIRAAQLRALRNIIREYCYEGERDKVFWAFRESLRYGFSPRTFAFFLIATAGARALSIALKQRARLGQRHYGILGQ